jgi:hypothetical protein
VPQKECVIVQGAGNAKEKEVVLEWERMGANGSEWERIGANGSEWEWMEVDG